MEQSGAAPPRVREAKPPAEQTKGTQTLGAAHDAGLPASSDIRAGWNTPDESRRRQWEPWLACATAGLALCLACEQYERYYALWPLGARTFDELVLVVLVTGGAFLVCGLSAMRRAKPLYARRSLLAMLALAQTAGVAIRILQMAGDPLPEPLAMAGPLLRQAEFVMLALYAQFFLDVGIRKSVQAFAWGLVASGIIQAAFTKLPTEVAIPLLLLFMPAAALLLGLASPLRSQADLAREREDISAELEASTGFSRTFSFWECCASIALVNVLLLVLHSRGMAFQDQSTMSAVMQLSAGFGCIVAGVAFLALLNYLQEAECLDLLRVTILPAVLIALYFSATIQAGSPAVYFTPLCVCYSMLMLLVWATPRYYRIKGSSFLCVCAVFFSFKLGWAVGLFGVNIAPSWWGSAVEVTFVFLAYTVLLLFSAFHAVRTWRMNVRNAAGSPATRNSSQPASPSQFDAACSHVADRFDLTPRESEVLPYLARGRNARHISEALVISDGTARTHIMHIYQKLAVKSQQELIDIVDESM